MAMNAAEARTMFEASRTHPDLITQIVPSPFGMRAHNVMKELLSSGFIGQLREVVVIGTLKNTLGPFHNEPALGRAWPGNFQAGAKGGRPAGAKYATVGYGLFEDFKLVPVKRPGD